VHCFGCSANCELFMEVLDEDLQSFLTRSEEMDPPFSLRDSLEMLLQVAEAVKHLHENSFIHGDLKPGNILLSKLAMPHRDVPFYLVKVADFGCAQRFHSSGVATREDFDFKIGSGRYRAPEMRRYCKLQGKDLQEAVQNIDPPKVDVFSFGVLANEVVSNVHESPVSDGNHLTSLKSYLRRCEAPDPRDRPSFGEICVTLTKFNDGVLCEKGGTLTRSLLSFDLCSTIRAYLLQFSALEVLRSAVSFWENV
jgi:serine/threonine protein kinase